MLTQKSTVLWQQGRYEDAIKSLEDNISLCPELAKQLEILKIKYHEESGVEYGNENMMKMKRFIDWMVENGAKFDKIRMKYYGPDYRGVHAFKPINQAENFLCVPKKLIITPQLGRETEIGRLVKKSGIKISWDYLFYIALFIMEQMHDEKSFWKPYMDVYPRNVSNFPMFYTAEEKAMLKGSPILSHIDSEIKEISDEYDKIVAAVPQFKKFTLEEYMRNKTLVISRIFFVKMHGVDDRIMVPLAGIFVKLIFE